MASCFEFLVRWLPLLVIFNSFLLARGGIRFSLGPVAIGVPANLGEVLDKEKCLGKLGCFSLKPPFYHRTQRPINVLPYDRDILDIKFLLFTRQSPKKPKLLFEYQNQSLTKSNFNPKVETTFIIHGFIDGMLLGTWLTDMKDEFLLRDDYNVVIVDWARANKFPYIQAVSNCRAVGAEIALLVKKLQDVLGADPKKMHIIGHSLGAHIAGYAGERIPNLGRITGMDPAGPYFTDTDQKVRLDQTDALFVDIVHSDAARSIVKGLGIVNSIGHVDFFPNNANNHPGCGPVLGINTIKSFLTEGPIDGVRHALACDHQRAVKFFAASINPNGCLFVGLQCPNWENFLSGKCGDCGADGSRCAVMGLDSPTYYSPKNKYKDFYLRTSADPPFCLYHYHVSVALDDDRSAQEVNGEVEIVVHGTEVTIQAKLSAGQEKFKPGTTKTYLVASKRDVGAFRSVDFIFAHKTGEDQSGIFGTIRSFFSKSKQIVVKHVRISPIKVGPAQVATFCAQGATIIPSGRTAQFPLSTKC